MELTMNNGGVLMREILFRGRNCQKEWFYGDLQQSADGTVSIYDGQYHIVEPETVGQYIGKVDDDGNQIFEGDIVYERHRNDENDDVDNVILVEYCTFDYSFSIADYEFIDSEFEIVGNIHDNPELEDNLT